MGIKKIKCFVFNVRKQQDAVDVQYQGYVARSRM